MAALQRMHALGRLAPEADPRQLALATLAALEGGLLLAQVHRDPEPLAAALDAMLTLIATLSGTTSGGQPQPLGVSSIAASQSN